MLIGLCGLPGNGKGTAATRLAEAHGFRHMKFAQSLKDMLRVMLRQAQLEPDEIERMIEGDLKELPHPALNGRTPRHAMQTLGTEWGRDCISPAIWGDIWERAAHALLENGHSVVVDDVRFVNEQHRVKKMGGFIVLIRGRKALEGEAHASDDMSWLRADYIIENTGTRAELDNKVSLLVEEIRTNVWS